MEIEALFFDNKFNYYTSEKINIPDGIVYTNKGGNRFSKVRDYIRDNWKDFGYRNKIMVIPASGDDAGIVGFPMMISPIEEEIRHNGVHTSMETW